MGYRSNESRYPQQNPDKLFICPRCHPEVGKYRRSNDFSPVKGKCYLCNDDAFECKTCYWCRSKIFLCGDHQNADSWKGNDKSNLWTKVIEWKISLFVLFVAMMLGAQFWSRKVIPSNIYVVDNLKQSYPQQSNETWYHILSILEVDIPTVKSIILLHGEDRKTSDCLTRQLVYSKNKEVEQEEITFDSFYNDFRDYGQALEHYRPLVKKYGIFVTDLNKVSASTARIFHSLCDEISSDIKPSLFIFTLQYNKNHEHLRPMKRATTILKEAWSELPGNELDPLLSRVVRNVVDVVPEKKVEC